MSADGTKLTDRRRAELYICMSCRCEGSAPAAEGIPTDGKRLYEAVQERIVALGDDAPARAIPMLCFANCEQGCSIAVAMAGKWSYLMGRLGPEHAADLIAYADAYANAASGVVLPSKRPESLQHTVIARFPSHLTPIKDAAE